jgi:hypothetical protein
VGEARKQFDELHTSQTSSGTFVQPSQTPQQPVIIVLHNMHWTPLYLVQDKRHIDESNITTQHILPLYFLHRFTSNLTEMVHEIHCLFPHTLLVYHSAYMVMHPLKTKSDAGECAWIDKMFVSLLNNTGEWKTPAASCDDLSVKSK